MCKTLNIEMDFRAKTTSYNSDFALYQRKGQFTNMCSNKEFREEFCIKFRFIDLMKRHYQILILILFLSAVFCSLSYAATTRNASTYAELISAITASSDNDIINITNNIVVTDSVIVGKTLIFNGNGYTISVPRPGLDEMGRFNTTPSLFRVFVFKGTSKTVTLNNLKIKGGYESVTGGAIYVSGNTTTLIINNCIISNSKAFSGGGITNMGILYMYNSIIQRNAANYAGGLFNSGNDTSSAGTKAYAYIESSTLVENRSTSLVGGGGAVENKYGAYLYFNNSTLSNNQSTELGGAINNNTKSKLWFVNSSATGNVSYGDTATAKGGAICNNGKGTITIVNSILAHNYHRTTGTTVNPTGFVLDDVLAYLTQDSVKMYYSIYHATLPTLGVSTNNIKYTGLANGSNNSMFSGGILAKITDSNGVEIGEQIYRPLLYTISGMIVPTLKSNSFASLNKGTRTRFANNNNVNPVVAYWNGSAYANLLGTSASGQEVIVDQINASRPNPPNRGAVEGYVDNLYLVKVLASANGTVSGGTIFGDVYPAGTPLTLIAIPNNGYAFTRWDYVLGGTGIASTSNPYNFNTPANNLTLQPVFSAITGYTITYVGNGNTGGTVPSGGTFSSSTNISGAGTMVRSGYYFLGWNTNSNGSGTTYSAGALYSAGTNLTLYALWIPSVNFTDGSSFTQSVTQGSSNQIIGTFSLNSVGGILTSAVIKLNGTRTGVSNLKLWEGTIGYSLNSQLGTTVAADPGEGNSISFNGFSSALTVPVKYFFITCDLASNSTGYILPVIVNNPSLTFNEAILPATITNAPLSGVNAPLPVVLSSFSASVKFNNVSLSWKTDTEINNSGFDIERVDYRQPAIGNWEKIGFIKGKGTVNTPTNYSFTDEKINAGKYQYRLKQKDNNGNYEFHQLSGTVEVGLPKDFKLSQNYPNPFNPTTKIDFSLPLDSKVSILIYDMTGREVKTLVNETRTAGYHTLELNASSLSSGTYFYRLIAIANGKDFISTKKFVLVK